MTTEITATDENMAIRIVIGRSTPTAIELVMNPLFASTRVLPYGEDSVRHTTYASVLVVLTVSILFQCGLAEVKTAESETGSVVFSD